MRPLNQQRLQPQAASGIEEQAANALALQAELRKALNARGNAMNGPLPGLHASTHLPQAGAPSLRQDSACDNQIRSGQRLRELITLLNGAEINT
ncbi:hypothetical protein QNH14_14370 [Apirhabdus apintestini]|nr:hypothetical protein QNH14_14370 [Enterobacteriaceae bacterium CA-0114]